MVVVDVQFPVCGNFIPVDHGYLLFSALAHLIPELHGDNGVAVHPINGPLAGNRCRLVTDQSRLTIRLPSERIREILPLAGKALSIGGHKVQVGVPYTRALVPSASLYSSLVVIKGFMEPAQFLEAVQRQLEALEVKGVSHLVEQTHIEETNRDETTGSHSPVLRRTIRIRDKEIVGFALGVEQLNAEESILVQEKGLGGRRRFGCGVFVPARTP